MLPENFIPVIKVFESVESTNDTLRQMSPPPEEGTVIVAREQTKGRGSRGRVWNSPKGGLYLSVFLKVQKRLTDLPLLAGVALAQTVQSVLSKAMIVSVKWPNDCMVNAKKVGGILCESCSTGCVVGIGLNVNLAAEHLALYQNEAFPATSIKILTEGETNIDDIQSVLLKKFFNLYRMYEQEGFSPIQYLWEKNCALIGKKIEFRDPNWATEGRPLTGTFLGIDETGALMIATGQGERRKFYSGEIVCYWP